MYELTFLLNDEGELKSLESLVESVEGKVVNKQKWGSKELAYPIKKQSTALYYTWELDVAPQKLKELKQKLNYSEKLLRYLLLKMEEKKK